MITFIVPSRCRRVASRLTRPGQITLAGDIRQLVRCHSDPSMESMFTFLNGVQSKCDIQSEVGGRGQRAERWLGSALSFVGFRNIIPAVSVELLLLLLEASLKETGLKHAETK